MYRIWLGLVATFGVVVGTVFAGQLEKADEGVSRGPAAGKASAAAAASAPDPFGQQKAVATEGQAERIPPSMGSTGGSSLGSSSMGGSSLGGSRMGNSSLGMGGFGSPTVEPRLSTRLPAEPAEPEALTVLKTGPEHTRLIYHLKASPARDMDRTIKQLLRSEGELRKAAATTAKNVPASSVAIVSDMISNSLVISVPPDAV
jgi:hypothetical protein